MSEETKRELTPDEVRHGILDLDAKIEQCRRDISNYRKELAKLQDSCSHKDTISLTEVQSFLASGTTVSGGRRCQDCGALLNANNEVVPEPEKDGK